MQVCTVEVIFIRVCHEQQGARDMVHSQDRQASLGALDQYTREVKWIPPLTDEEEACLLQQIGCDQARVRLIERYQGYMLSSVQTANKHGARKRSNRA